MNSAPPSRPGNKSLRRGRVSIPGQIYHVTARAIADTQPFVNALAAFAACRAFHVTARASDARLLAWVLMPDHAHWLIELGERDDLSPLVARLKSASAGASNAAIGSPPRTSLWQAGFHDRAIRSDEDLLVVARYVVANPLRANLVSRLGDYPWWDSVWL